MLASTALRHATRTALQSVISSSSVSVGKATPSLCQLFDASLRLSSTSCDQASSSTSVPGLLLNNKLSASQSHRQPISGNHFRHFSSKSDTEESTAPSKPQASQQHETWVEFQKSISITGFETGQTTKVTTRTKKRGGTVERKRRLREEELDAALSRGKAFDITTLKGGEFPPLRYSDEETARLLEEAYANLPPRAGKRGTRYLKREKHRWWIKRMYDVKKKHERMAEHERRMAKRHNISKWIYEIQQGAEEVKEKDRAYQLGVLERWAEINGYAEKDMSEGRVEQNE